MTPGGMRALSPDCQSAWKRDPGSASNWNPYQRLRRSSPESMEGTRARRAVPSRATERRAWDAVRAILHNPVPKLGQNFGSFDAPWLLSRMGIRVRNYCHDLRLLHKTLYPELPASLQFMGNSYSRQGSWKHWSKESGVREKARGAKRDE